MKQTDEVRRLLIILMVVGILVIGGSAILGAVRSHRCHERGGEYIQGQCYFGITRG